MRTARIKGGPVALAFSFGNTVLSVDARLRNFSRGLLIGSHGSGALSQRINSITDADGAWQQRRVGIHQLLDGFVTSKSKYPACQSPSLPGSRVASSCWEAVSTIAITTKLLTRLSSPSLLKTSICK